ncbi:hypothetical protein N8I77_013188 [Diaporthe amygdali]|uniref:HRDC domain-containing protein n=1 Tax=Phomopsis amygdali TaxID=1214568 RepID=A0AAD9S120_PHOAM|nr:hypothetical protein N8I77_013188 [Diaporthe amygdali]
MDARDNSPSNAREGSTTQATWPLRFRLKLPEPKQRGAVGDLPPEAGPREQVWWSYDLYRGPRNQKSKVLYARSKAEAEKIAHEFLQEEVVGFDMEWPCFDGTTRSEDRLQDKVGLIAIACETKVALFHIGAYTGKKPKDFIGPTLQAIIESPRIKKAGVNILTADFARLREWFELDPQGAVELSHLHNLVTYGCSGQASLCTTKLCALEKQVQTHLQLPLKKSRVRTSNWSQKKQLSREQKAYAASDAYAGFMLYHYLSSLRLSMEPSPPPPPLYAERYKSLDIPRRGTALLLDLEDSGDEGIVNVITALDYFEGRHENIHSARVMSSTMPTSQDSDLEGSQEPLSAPIQQKAAMPSAMRTSYYTNAQRLRSNPSSKKPDTLLQKLKVHREKIAKQRRLDTWKIIHTSALKLIAEHKPENETALMNIKGVGPQKVKKYGAAFLNIVALHVGRDRQSTDAEQSDKDTDPSADEAILRSGGGRNPTDTTQNNSPSPGTSQLHTVVSSTVQNKGPSSGGLSQPNEVEGSNNVASPRIPTSHGVKRKRAQTGPHHGLLRYFKIGEDSNSLKS